MTMLEQFPVPISSHQFPEPWFPVPPPLRRELGNGNQIDSFRPELLLASISSRAEAPRTTSSSLFSSVTSNRFASVTSPTPEGQRRRASLPLESSALFTRERCTTKSDHHRSAFAGLDRVSLGVAAPTFDVGSEVLS